MAHAAKASGGTSRSVRVALVTLAAFAAMGGPAGCARDRVLPPRAAEAVRAFAGRLGPGWRLDRAELQQREVRVVLCPAGAGAACRNLVLSDPTRRCPGDRIGAWCATFADGPIPDDVLRALEGPGDDPWMVPDGAPRHVRADAWPWIAGAGAATFAGLLIWRARRRHAGRPGRGARRLRPVLRVGGVLLASAATLAALGLAAEFGVRAWSRLATPPAAPDGYDLYAVGGSTMAGEPWEPHVSAPLLVRAAFDGRLDGRAIRVHNLARKGWSAYAQSVLLERTVRGRDPALPGALLVYTGHNEGRVHAGDAPPPAIVAWLDENALAFRELARALPRLRPANTLARFEQTLTRIVRTARTAGLVPIVATAASNEAGVEPNVPPGAITAGIRARLDAGRRLEDAGRLAEAASAYLDGIDRSDPGWPLSAYRAAGCLRRDGDVAGANALYAKVLEADPRTRFGRATPAQNEAVRRVAAREGVPLVDAEALFRDAVPDRVLDARLFADGHHPNLAGQRVLAAGFAGALAAVVGAPPPPPLARDEDVCRVLACPPRDLSAPFLNAATWLLASSVQHPDPRDRLALARANLEAAAARDPDDPRVRFALALTHAALRGALLWDDDDLERLPGLGIAFGGRPCLAPDQRDAWLARFAGIGVPPDVLAALRRASDPATGRGCDPVLRDDADRQDPAER
jgi:tetratricopeptide (TPR) repeat protein